MPVVADVSEHSSTPPAPVVDDANHHVDAARPAQPAGCAPLSHQAHAEMTSAKDPASVTEAAIERDVKTPESSDLHTPSHTVGVAARPLSRTLYRTDSTASTAIAEPSDLHHACEVSPRAPSTTSTPSPMASISPPTCSASASASGLAPTPRSAVTGGEECGARDASPAAMDADLPDEADVARMLLAFCSSAAARGAGRSSRPPASRNGAPLATPLARRPNAVPAKAAKNPSSASRAPSSAGGASSSAASPNALVGGGPSPAAGQSDDPTRVPACANASAAALSDGDRNGGALPDGKRRHWSGVYRESEAAHHSHLRQLSPDAEAREAAARRKRMNHLRRCNEDMRMLMLGWKRVEASGEAGRSGQCIYEHPVHGRARSKKEIFRIHKGERLDFNSNEADTLSSHVREMRKSQHPGLAAAAVAAADEDGFASPRGAPPSASTPTGDAAPAAPVYPPASAVAGAASTTTASAAAAAAAATAATAATSTSTPPPSAQMREAPAVWSPPHSAATVAPPAVAATSPASSAADAAASPPMSIATAAAGAHAPDAAATAPPHESAPRRPSTPTTTPPSLAKVAEEEQSSSSVRVVLKFSGAGMPPAAEMGGEQPAPYATDARNDNGKRPRPIEAGTGGTDGADALDNTSPQTCGKRQAPKHQFLLAAGACTP